MTLKLTLTCDNAAFGNGYGFDLNEEIHRIIEHEDFGNGATKEHPVLLRDTNGNHVGDYYFTDNDEEA